MGRLVFLVELAAAITSLVFWKNLKEIGLKEFGVFLVLLFVGELFSEFLNAFKFDSSVKTAFYNVFVPLQTLFYLWFLKKHIQVKENKVWINIFMFLFLLSLIISVIYYKSISYSFFNYSFAFGSCFVAIACMFYFYSKIQQENFYDSIALHWIFLGILLYYAGSTPFMSFFNTMILTSNENVRETWFTIIHILSLLMYSLFIYGIIKGVKNVKVIS